MVEAASPSPIEAPPPSYEIAQQDFEQKLATVAERSLIPSEQQHDQPQNINASPEEHSEDSDEAIHQVNVSRCAVPQPTVQANGQYPTVRPLNFKKKVRSSNAAGGSTKAKERPSWFSEAQLAASRASGRPLPMPRASHDHIDRSTEYILPEESEEDRSIPPPPFVDVDTSLDGPAYERYPRNDPRRRRTGALPVVLRYAGEDPSASPPPSPPHTPPHTPVIRHSSPSMHLRQRTASPRNIHGNNVFQHAPQQLRLQAQTPVLRPKSADSARLQYVPPPPRLNFDPSVAYEGTKPSIFGQLPVETRERSLDATALYSSAVAPHMSSQKSRPVTAPKVNRYASSISSLPEYDQQQVSQSASSAKPLYAVQEYAASRASVYSQSSVNDIPQYPQFSRYPQMAQYSAQQPHNGPMSLVQQGDKEQHWSITGAQYQPQYYQR